MEGCLSAAIPGNTPALLPVGNAPAQTNWEYLWTNEHFLHSKHISHTAAANVQLKHIWKRGIWFMSACTSDSQVFAEVKIQAFALRMMRVIWGDELDLGGSGSPRLGSDPRSECLTRLFPLQKQPLNRGHESWSERHNPASKPLFLQRGEVFCRTNLQ